MYEEAIRAASADIVSEILSRVHLREDRSGFGYSFGDGEEPFARCCSLLAAGNDGKMSGVGE
jgi:hypothetical protein